MKIIRLMCYMWVMFFCYISCRNIAVKKYELNFPILSPGEVGNNFKDFYLKMYPDTWVYKQISHYDKNYSLQRVDIEIIDKRGEFMYLITPRYVDSSLKTKSNDTNIVFPSISKYIIQHGNVIWTKDENRNIIEYEYYYLKDTLIVRYYKNDTLQKVSYKYLFNKKNKPILFLEYYEQKLTGFFKYYYEQDSIPIMIEEYNKENLKMGNKNIIYNNQLIVINSFSNNNLFALDSVFLDTRNCLKKIVSYDVEDNGLLTLSKYSIYSFDKMDTETYNFIYKYDMDLFNQLYIWR
jgi:hypothetical protein